MEVLGVIIKVMDTVKLPKECIYFCPSSVFHYSLLECRQLHQKGFNKGSWKELSLEKRDTASQTVSDNSPSKKLRTMLIVGSSLQTRIIVDRFGQ